ncbi:MAG: hypothetical protein ACYCY0_14240, partial [Acidithiobacillus ferrivorans]
MGKQQINQSAGPMQVNNGTPAPVPVKSNPDSELAVMALIREYDRQEREMMKLKGHELGMIG